MREFISVAREGIRIFMRASGSTNAAAISFYAFFSLIPVMFLVTAGVGFVLGARPELQERVVGMVSESLPYLSDTIIRELEELSENWRTFGWIGLLSLVFAAEFVMSAMVRALTSIFGTEKSFGILRTRLIGLLMILLAILAALSSVAVTALSYTIQDLNTGIQGLQYVFNLLSLLLFGLILPFFLVAGIIAVVFRVLAGANLDFRHAFLGSMVFAILWEAAKQLFALYVANFQSYNKFYGSIGALMILLMWIYYSASLFLLSASVARAAYLASGPRRAPRPRTH
ncbi:MAG: YihY/virulence factor BrkB family protein [Thermodesulfobacteriota bacterium]|nr:MAG: YihY/virulence factor BrkB family protein [Thermodesulfobacteriota bacterium]